MAKQTIQIADKPTLDEVLAMLNDAETGLASLKSLLGENADAETLAAVKELLQNGTYGLNALKTAINTANSTLGNGTYGLSALKTAINGRANESTVAAVKSLLENSTYGLNAIKSVVNTINNKGAVKSVQRGIASVAGSYLDVTINSVDTNKTFVMGGLQCSKSDLSYYAYDFGGVYLLNNTTIRVLKTSRNDTMNIEWQVIEFY